MNDSNLRRLGDLCAETACGLANRRLQPLGHVSSTEIVEFLAEPPDAGGAYSANEGGSSRHRTRHTIPPVRSQERIAVWFSCGAASAVAAKLTLDRFPEADVRIVNNPVQEEDPDNRRFLADVAAWLGREIEEARHSAFPDAACDSVWKRERGMVFPHGAPCTKFLKKGARVQWEERNHPDWHVLGFTADERRRHERFILTERSNVIPVLIDAGLTKDACFDVLHEAGIKLPAMYGRGYPNANCIGCVKATSPTYWNHVRRADPEVFAERAKQSREYGAKPVKLVKYKGTRITLDELPPDAMGRPMKSLRSFECGIFCEERVPAPLPARSHGRSGR
jgi:hypothetical protein